MNQDSEARFEFGHNWYDFIRKNFGAEKVKLSQEHMLSFLKRTDLSGLSFLDIGCGSGLHSIAALQAGAGLVYSFDYDQDSVNATVYVKQQIGEPDSWTIEQGSVLDDDYMAHLAQFDLVYSWGVLHHTGDVWHALRNAAERVKPGGLLYIALYSADVQVDPPAEFWLDIKRKYVASGWLHRRQMDLWYIWRFYMNRRIWNLPRFFMRIREYEKGRGMSLFTDVRDWLGGWPMEFVYDADAIAFCEGLGFKLKRLATGEANSEFLFVRNS